MVLVYREDKGNEMTVTGPDGKEYPAGDLEPRVWCSRCEKPKPLSDFHFAAKNVGRHQRGYNCKSCTADAERARKAGMPVPPVSSTVEREARRDKVVELYDQGLTHREIADRFGVVPSTIQRDLQARGRNGEREKVIRETGHVPVQQLKVADGVVRQLYDLANLVYDGRRVILPLEGLPVPPEMATDWEKSLVHVGKALRYLRSHAKKGNTE